MNKKSLTSRQIQAAETKERIYKSAEYLFKKMEYDDVSIDDIVTHAKVSKGSFYVYYKSKDDLFIKVLSGSISGVDAEYKSFFETLPAEMPVGQAFLEVVGKIADVLADSLGHDVMKKLYKAFLTDGIETATVTEYSRGLYLLFSSIIKKGVERQEFRCECSPEETARSFVAAYRGVTLEWCIRFPDYDLKKQAVQMFKIMIEGIKTGA
ncbi:MAG: TetR/AcrR family transcriptional regulator [Clostridiales bacterium]|nr:TetR/AcrR family transcriptional regulator [Clostridiales bacterium]